MTDIATEQAIKRVVRDQETAGMIAGMLTITHGQQRKIGFLEGVIVAMLLSVMALGVAVYDRQQTLEIYYTQLKAKVELYEREKL